MLTFKELNHKVSLGDQIQRGGEGPVVLINVFTIAAEDEEALLKAWARDAEIMKAQPGYISTQLHKAIANSPTYVNYAIWESVESFGNAFNNPEFQASLQHYPESAVTSPHLFKKLAVPGHCVA